jgi:hypothetical protein
MKRQEISFPVLVGYNTKEIVERPALEKRRHFE